MSTAGQLPFFAAIVGGSVGGLAAAIELKEKLSAKVAIYERSANVMQVRGAGVVMQAEVDDLLRRIGVSARSVSVELQERVGLQKDGTSHGQPAPQLMTAWDTLYKTMRAHVVNDCYRQDSKLLSIERTDDSVAITFEDAYSAEADLVIGADGVNSTCRDLLSGVPQQPQYAGYVAWRGLENERDLPASLVNALSGRFTSFIDPGMQMLCYLVPGADGQTEPGARRVNWVWYVNTSADKLSRLMTGDDGVRYQSFLPPGHTAADVQAEVHDLADSALPPVFRDLVQASTLFMQPVQDVDAQRRTYGRAVLVGDAAGTVRPHTASGTSKAFGDASLLAGALAGWKAADPLPSDKLEQWGDARNAQLELIARRGIQLARQSGLGA